jgi:hypothetical protein
MALQWSSAYSRCVCVCVCVCERERERARERECVIYLSLIES